MRLAGNLSLKFVLCVAYSASIVGYPPHIVDNTEIFSCLQKLFTLGLHKVNLCAFIMSKTLLPYFKNVVLTVLGTCNKFI